MTDKRNSSSGSEPMILDETHRIYSILSEKPFLAGMRFPRSPEVWRRLGSLGFDSVVCLAGDAPNYDPAPLRLLAAAELDDLFGGRVPGDPAGDEQKIRVIVPQIVNELDNGRSVVVHCEGGTGRTGTVLACVLRELGTPLEQVLQTMDIVNQVRGRSPGGWPESEWQRTVVHDWM